MIFFIKVLFCTQKCPNNCEHFPCYDNNDAFVMFFHPFQMPKTTTKGWFFGANSTPCTFHQSSSVILVAVCYLAALNFPVLSSLRGRSPAHYTRLAFGRRFSPYGDFIQPLYSRSIEKRELEKNWKNCSLLLRIRIAKKWTPFWRKWGRKYSN